MVTVLKQIVSVFTLTVSVNSAFLYSFHLNWFDLLFFFRFVSCSFFVVVKQTVSVSLRCLSTCHVCKLAISLNISYV